VSRALSSPGRSASPWAMPRTRGAVYVEFLVAFLPLFIFFECLLQLAALGVANLVTQHAAACAARAAVVVLPDDPKYYGGVPVGQTVGNRLRDIERAAQIPLGAVGGIVSTTVSVSASPGDSVPRAFAPDEVVSVRVEALYECGFPLAAHLVCSARSGRSRLVAEAALVNHGARYVYD
jgi:hypothetical protein